MTQIRGFHSSVKMKQHDVSSLLAKQQSTTGFNPSHHLSQGNSTTDDEVDNTSEDGEPYNMTMEDEEDIPMEIIYLAVHGSQAAVHSATRSSEISG